MSEPAYLEISRRKVAERDSKIPTEWKVEVPDRDDLTGLPRESSVLSEREVAITENYDSVGLLERIRDGTYTSVEVTLAFCKVNAHSYLNR
jgi:amidase